MGCDTTLEAATNTTPQSCHVGTCDCDTIWSLAQQFAYLRLSNPTGDFRSCLVESYSARARRIAGTYARFYLELEEGGDPEKKGRFYWMALGAFASKTVACTLEAWQLWLQQKMVSETTKEGLGKGNFWLFCDISGWHWYYSNFPDSFQTCVESRNAGNYVPKVRAQVEKLPWASQALPIINNLGPSGYIRTGFKLVRQYEQEQNESDRLAIQFKHLLAIADHEQRVILQPLIYADEDFAFWIKFQRSRFVSWISPNLELTFTSSCYTEDESAKSTAPEGTILEDERSRMAWISEAAKLFHDLMKIRRHYMEGQLEAMSGWINN